MLLIKVPLVFVIPLKYGGGQTKGTKILYSRMTIFKNMVLQKSIQIPLVYIFLFFFYLAIVGHILTFLNISLKD